MRSPERYLLSLSVVYGLTNFLLAFYTMLSMDFYASVYILEYFALTLLYAPLNPKTQKITNLISYLLFGVFTAIITLKVLQITGASLI